MTNYKGMTEMQLVKMEFGCYGSKRQSFFEDAKSGTYDTDAKRNTFMYSLDTLEFQNTGFNPSSVCACIDNYLYIEKDDSNPWIGSGTSNGESNPRSQHRHIGFSNFEVMDGTNIYSKQSDESFAQKPLTKTLEASRKAHLIEFCSNTAEPIYTTRHEGISPANAYILIGQWFLISAIIYEWFVSKYVDLYNSGQKYKDGKDGKKRWLNGWGDDILFLFKWIFSLAVGVVPIVCYFVLCLSKWWNDQADEKMMAWRGNWYHLPAPGFQNILEISFFLLVLIIVWNIGFNVASYWWYFGVKSSEKKAENKENPPGRYQMNNRMGMQYGYYQNIYYKPVAGPSPTQTSSRYYRNLKAAMLQFETMVHLHFESLSHLGWAFFIVGCAMHARRKDLDGLMTILIVIITVAILRYISRTLHDIYDFTCEQCSDRQLVLLQMYDAKTFDNIAESPNVVGLNQIQQINAERSNPSDSMGFMNLDSIKPASAGVPLQLAGLDKSIPPLSAKEYKTTVNLRNFLRSIGYYRCFMYFSTLVLSIFLLSCTSVTVQNSYMHNAYEGKYFYAVIVFTLYNLLSDTVLEMCPLEFQRPTEENDGNPAVNMSRIRIAKYFLLVLYLIWFNVVSLGFHTTIHHAMSN